MAASGEIKLTKSARTKSKQRAAAETSLRSATSFLHTIAASMFVISNPPAGRSISSDASSGAHKLVDLIRTALLASEEVDSEVEGGSDGYPDTGSNEPLIYAIHRALMLSTDGTTVFTHSGPGDDGKDKWVLADANACGRTYSLHRPCDTASNHFNGISVRLTVTLSAAGFMSPKYATVTGLTDRKFLGIKFLMGELF